jgi:hypothetical protein
MYNLPLVNGNGKPITLGNEFNILYGGEMRDGLIEPTAPIMDYSGETKNLFTTLNIDGVNNQSRLFENNDDPSEEYQLTDNQALQNILNRSSSNRPMTDQEKRLQLYTDHTWDERFRQELIRESIEDRSNIFYKESQDFVNDVRKANEHFHKEENLYVPRSLLKQEKDKKHTYNFNDPIGAGLDILLNQVKKEKQKQKGRETYRQTFTGGKPTPTQDEKFQKIQKLKTGEDIEPFYYEPARQFFFN